MSLHEFVRQAWPHLETDIAFVDNWHIQALCEHLEAVLDGRIKQLLVNVPPGCMKSLLTAVFLPMWAWGPRARPETRWMFISYDQKLSTRDSRKCRTLLQSDWYQANWGHVFRIVGDQNQKIAVRQRRVGLANCHVGGRPGDRRAPRRARGGRLSERGPGQERGRTHNAASNGGTRRFPPAAFRAACGGS